VTFGPPRGARGPLALFDIGGYTSFLQAVAAAHADDAFAEGAVPPAYAVLSNLLDGIVEAVAPPLTLAKLEGDAVFAYATETAALPRGEELLTWLASAYSAFDARLDQARDLWSCSCDACIRLDLLDLKAVVHAGPFVLSGIAGREELTGPEVVLAHRLLKSSAAQVAGTSAYALLTSAAVQALDVPTESGRPLTEAVEHYAPVDCVVFDLRTPA
jgi:Protein of unknown function (DUF2652)